MSLLDKIKSLVEARKSKKSFLRRKKKSGSGDLGNQGSGSKKHSPYKRKTTLGPTHKPMLRGSASSPSPRKTRTVHQKKYWSCHKIAKYTQQCVGRKGEKMKLKKKVSYMKDLNRTTKRWEKQLRHHIKKYPGGRWHKRNPHMGARG